MSKLQLPVIVTPSRVELGLRCYRRHTIADLLQRARYKSPSLEFGSVMHAGAGAWWLTGDPVKAQTVLAGEWNKRFAEPSKDLTYELAAALLGNYMTEAKLAGPFTDQGTWQTVCVEDRLEVPLNLGTSQAKLSFQMDRVLWNQATKHLVIVDTKTAGRLDAKWARQWQKSLQMKLYKAGLAKAFDFEPDTIDVVIEGVLKDLPPKIQYEICPDWSQSILDEAVRQAVSIAKRDYLLISMDEPNPPYTVEVRPEASIMYDALVKTEINYMSCFEYGVQCPFHDLCMADPEHRVAMLHADYFEIPEEDSGY